jgi:hypothetical protein
VSAYAKLRRRRQLFVDAYVRLGVGADAYRELVPDSKRPDQQASRLLANPDVKAAVEERTQLAIARAGARHVRLVEEVCTLAYARLSGLRGADGKPVAFKDIPVALLDAAESIEFETDGRVKRIRIAKTQGMRMLGELMKAFPQVHEHQGKDGGPIETKETGELSDLDRARRIAFILQQGLREAAAKPNTPLSQNSTDDDDDSPTAE